MNSKCFQNSFIICAFDHCYPMLRRFSVPVTIGIAHPSIHPKYFRLGKRMSMCNGQGPYLTWVSEIH